MRIPLLILLWAACLASSPVAAHGPLTHNCVAPTRPVDDQNDVLWSRFLAEIEAFQSCVTAEADRQTAAAEAHQQAARDVVEAWNQFVRSSLNAPEDFPWPPPEDGSH